MISQQQLNDMWLQLLAVAKCMSANIRANDEYGDSTEVDKLIRKIDTALKDTLK